MTSRDLLHSDVSNNPFDDVNEHVQLIVDFCKDDINVRKLKIESHMISDFFQISD